MNDPLVMPNSLQGFMVDLVITSYALLGDPATTCAWVSVRNMKKKTQANLMTLSQIKNLILILSN